MFHWDVRARNNVFDNPRQSNLEDVDGFTYPPNPREVVFLYSIERGVNANVPNVWRHHVAMAIPFANGFLYMRMELQSLTAHMCYKLKPL